MKIELTLKKDQARELEWFLRKKYDSKKSNLANLTKLFLLEFIVAESKKESDAALAALERGRFQKTRRRNGKGV